MSITLLLLYFILQGTRGCDMPNIVIILADDLGFNDISFHGSDQFLTPNIDSLAYSGVICHDYYTQPICTPARAALLTGRLPVHNGMEHDVIYAPEPWGLPLSEQLMPQYLQSQGYATHAIGKWHLGFFKSNYTPTRRGFDSHYGIWLGHQDHYTHMGYEPNPGYDFHRGLNVTWEAQGKYTTDLFTEEAETIINSHNTTVPLFMYVAHTAPHAPLQAPKELVKKFSYIPNGKRQIYAAMVTKVDESVGRIMKALKDKNMINNTIVLFLSDNGGATNGFNGNVASNWPLRGCKDTLWEGGVRGVGVIWSPLLQAVPRVHYGLVNVQDWLPTLLSAAGLSESSLGIENIDGVSQWEALNNRSAAPYKQMLHNIDPLRNISALRSGDWKIVTGRTYNGTYDGFYGRLNGKVNYDIEAIRSCPAGQAIQMTSTALPDTSTMLKLRNQATVSCQPTTGTPHVINVREAKKQKSNSPRNKLHDTYACKPHLAPCLFNLATDPCEKMNVAADYPDEVNKLMAMITSYQLTPPNNKPPDPNSYPSNWNHTWIPWQDYVK